MEEQQRKSGDGRPVTFRGFGKSGIRDDAAWVQWMDHVLWVAEGMPDDDEDEEEYGPAQSIGEVQAQDDQEDDALTAG